MTVEELQHIIHTREKRTLEFKRAWSEVPSNLFETICAFLNRDGGTIILGAEDDGHVERGINPAALEQISKNISNLSNNPQKLYPPFLLQPDPINIDGKIVLVLSIPSSSQVHKTAGKVFDRSNDGDYELKTDAEISALYQRKSTQYSENHIYPYLRITDLRQDTIEKARNMMRGTRPQHPWLELSDMDMFRQANLYRHDFTTDQEGFTLAALMLFGKQESIQSVLPYYKVDAVVRIDNTDRYDDRLSIFGNVIDGYGELMRFIEKHLPDPFYMEGDRRISLREKIFREIIANMLVHREYLNPTPTIIEITREGIFAKNANRPLKAGPVTLANYSSHPKNPHMANFFVQMGLAEHLGTGIRNIYKYTPIYTGAQPRIDDEDIYLVQLGLPKLMAQQALREDIQKDIQKKLTGRSIKISKNQMSVAILILQNPSITRMEMSHQLGLADVSVTSCISALKHKGLLIRKGGRRYGEWILTI